MELTADGWDYVYGQCDLPVLVRFTLVNRNWQRACGKIIRRAIINAGGQPLFERLTDKTLIDELLAVDRPRFTRLTLSGHQWAERLGRRMLVEHSDEQWCNAVRKNVMTMSIGQYQRSRRRVEEEIAYDKFKAEEIDKVFSHIELQEN